MIVLSSFISTLVAFDSYRNEEKEGTQILGHVSGMTALLASVSASIHLVTRKSLDLVSSFLV